MSYLWCSMRRIYLSKILLSPVIVNILHLSNNKKFKPYFEVFYLVHSSFKIDLKDYVCPKIVWQPNIMSLYPHEMRLNWWTLLVTTVLDINWFNIYYQCKLKCKHFDIPVIFLRTIANTLNTLIDRVHKILYDILKSICTMLLYVIWSF